MRIWYRSYAGTLADTELYDQQMVSVVYIMQGRLRDSGKLPANKVNGIIGASTKVAMGYLAATTVDIRPVLFTVCGTGVPWWIGPDADMARAVENQYLWQPIGYPAAPVPMGPSIAEGRGELVNQFTIHRVQVERNGAVLAGYSQGACVTSECWEGDIKPVGGALNWAKPYIRKAVTWGNPDREQGKVWPDFAAGQDVAPANSSGVTGTLMVNTPDWWRNYAHKGDLYAAGGTGSPGDASSQDKTAIWQIIRGTKVFSGPDSLLAQFLEIAQSPIPGAIGAFKAMWDAGAFFGGGLTQHTSYNVGPAIDYLRS
jgi:hypothetical protein